MKKFPLRVALLDPRATNYYFVQKATANFFPRVEILLFRFLYFSNKTSPQTTIPDFLLLLLLEEFDHTLSL